MCEIGQLSLQNDPSFRSCRVVASSNSVVMFVIIGVLLLSTQRIYEVECLQCNPFNFRSAADSNLYMKGYSKHRTPMIQRQRKYSSYSDAAHRQGLQFTVLPIAMSTKDDDTTAQESKKVGTTVMNETATITSTDSQTTTSSNNRSTLSKTLVLALPLMLKFALVLIIKFLTDLVVFPLLFTYRGARVMKRRISKLWNRWTSSTTTTSTGSNNEENDIVSLESYNANGSVPTSDQR